jgi:hypothetical protein
MRSHTQPIPPSEIVISSHHGDLMIPPQTDSPLIINLEHSATHVSISVEYRVSNPTHSERSSPDSPCPRRNELN